jgi:hypothetical protein
VDWNSVSAPWFIVRNPQRPSGQDGSNAVTVQLRVIGLREHRIRRTLDAIPN